MAQLTAYLTITRPINVIIGIFSIFVGALITGTLEPLAKVLLACLSGGVIAGAANAINDYYDLEIDRINKPNRPLPAGKLTPTGVFNFSVIFFGVGIVLGALVNLQAFFIALFSSGLLFLYSARLKRTVLWGNLSVSLVTGLAFIYGGVAVNRFYASLIPAGFSFFFHLGREIIKDTQDVEGDAANQVVTFPIQYGKKPALIAATAVYLFLIVLTLLPYFYQIYGFYYLIVVLLGVDGVVVAILFSIWCDSSAKNLGRMSNLLKADMLVGLVAIFLGRTTNSSFPF